MKIVKEALGGQEITATGEDMALINALARKELGAEEVYTFSVRLCDNEVDRDGERFAPRTLEELAGLFLGKSGIFDHQWSARGQAARIYKTEVVREPDRITRAGDGYCWLKGYAYMVRTDSTRDLIAEIEGGIKKEVSVSCAVSRCVCSICGNDINDRALCSHVKGRIYEGKRCMVKLEDPTDAYEWSFVAVPAQRSAGVVKAYGTGKTLRQMLAGLDRSGPWEAELRQLEKEAETGRMRKYYRITRKGLKALEEKKEEWTVFTEKVNAVVCSPV